VGQHEYMLGCQEENSFVNHDDNKDDILRVHPGLSHMCTAFWLSDSNIDSEQWIG